MRKLDSARFGALSTILALSATAALAIPAQGGPPSPTPESEIIEACTDAAKTAGADLWTCADGELVYTVPGANVGDEPETARVPRMRTVNPDRGSTVRGGVSPLVSQADYDGYWCEDVSGPCTRYPNSYIAITKVNIWYGQGATYVGQFDVVLKVSLNGRQPIFEGTWDHDQGPSIVFSSQRINCVKDQTFDANCGQHVVDGDGSFWLTVGAIYNTGSIYNSRLTLSDDYFATITGKFQPQASGAPVLTMPTVRSPNFNCFGTGNCYFPNAA